MIKVRLMARAHRPGFTYVDTQLYELNCEGDTYDPLPDRWTIADMTFIYDHDASDGSLVYLIGKEAPQLVEMLKDKLGHPVGTLSYARPRERGGFFLFDGTYVKASEVNKL